MTDRVTVKQLRARIAIVARALIESSDELNTLDAATGDGDMGISVRIGAEAVLAELERLEEADAGALLAALGMAFNRAAGSTIGALVATAGMRSGAVLKGQFEMDLASLSTAFRSAIEGIAERGKAKRGDKTLLDAMIPAAEALDATVNEGGELAEAASRALEAAEAGMRKTAGMLGKVGRGKWSGERGREHPDAGAAAVVIALRAIAISSEPRTIDAKRLADLPPR